MIVRVVRSERVFAGAPAIARFLKLSKEMEQLRLKPERESVQTGGIAS